MLKSVIIAVDAMGGDNSPGKVIAGISEYLKKNNNVFFRIFGNSFKIEDEIKKNSIDKDNFELIHCDDVVEINQYGTKHSLNVSIAAGIVIWNFFKLLNKKI